MLSRVMLLMCCSGISMYLQTCITTDVAYVFWAFTADT